jgi:uncharacterized membrane protein
MSNIIHQVLQYVALAFAVGLLIYDVQQFDMESGSSYISMGGALSLLVILGYMIFTRFKMWLESEFMGHNIGYLWLVMTYAFLFAVYSFYSFSMELYKEYQKVNKGSDQETLILNGLGALGSLAAVILLSPYAAQSIAITLMFIIVQPYMIYEYLTKKSKKRL